MSTSFRCSSRTDFVFTSPLQGNYFIPHVDLVFRVVLRRGSEVPHKPAFLYDYRVVLVFWYQSPFGLEVRIY